MSWITKFVFSLLVIIALGLLLLIFSPYGFDSTQATLNRNVAIGGAAENTTPVDVLAIDLNQYGAKDIVDRLHSGEAELLLLRDEQHGKQQIYVFNTISALAKFDTDHSGSVDLADPVFKRLVLAKFDYAHKILYYTPLGEAGIASIAFNPKYLAGELLSDPRRYDEVAAKVIYTDSSSHSVVRVAVLPASDLQQMTLQPMPKSQ